MPLHGGRGSETLSEPRALASGSEIRLYANFCNLALALPTLVQNRAALLKK